jgi:hypothetical protein
MPEPVASSWRGRLADDYVKNLSIVLDDGNKLLNCWLWRYGSKVICVWQHSLRKYPDGCLNRIRRALLPRA